MKIIDVTYDDPLHGKVHVEVSSPYGGGSGFHVMVNNYFVGQIVCYNNGWVSFVRTPILMQDDIDAIMETIREVSPCNPRV